MSTDTKPQEGFISTGLSPVILEALTRLKFTVPTPIQAQAIPVAIKGTDIIGIADTGTGKTLAFGLPILEKLLQDKHKKALIIVPTRELALQVEESLARISNALPQRFRSVSLIGGAPIYKQIQKLRTKPEIIVATPGRLNDHLQQKTVTLHDIDTLVLDEADRMLDMGFAPQIKEVMSYMPKTRQTMLFSATFAPEIAKLSTAFLTNPERIEIPSSGSAKNVSQELCYVRGDKKGDLLQTMLDKHDGTILIFSRTKHGASKLSRKIQDFGHSATEIHSNRSLSQRRMALEGFRRGKYRVLVATDVASRGIDVKDIQVVINYDLPDSNEDYVHRIGRTGRAGQTGLAISFATPDQYRDVKAIERLIKQEIPISEHSERMPDRPTYAPTQSRKTSSFRPKRRAFQNAGKGWR